MLDIGALKSLLPAPLVFKKFEEAVEVVGLYCVYEVFECVWELGLRLLMRGWWRTLAE